MKALWCSLAKTKNYRPEHSLHFYYHRILLSEVDEQNSGSILYKESLTNAKIKTQLQLKLLLQQLALLN